MYKNILYGLLLTIFIIFLSFFYLISKNIPENFYQIFHILDKKYILLSLMFLFFFHTFDNLRVFVISRALGLKYSFFYGYVVSFVSTFGATVTPAHLGGEFLPLYTLKRIGGDFHEIMSIITLKGFSGLFFYIIFFPFTIHVLINNPKETKDLLVLLGVILLISLLVYILWTIVFKKRESIFTKEQLIKIKYTVFRYLILCKNFLKTKKKYFFLSLILSLLMYFSYICIGIFLVKAFNSSGSVKDLFLDQLPLIYAIFMSPTPGGSGVGELGAIPIFGSFVPKNWIGIFAIMWRILSQYLGAFIGGIIFLILTWKDIKQAHQ